MGCWKRGCVFGGTRALWRLDGQGSPLKLDKNITAPAELSHAVPCVLRMSGGRAVRVWFFRFSDCDPVQLNRLWRGRFGVSGLMGGFLLQLSLNL